MNAIAHSSSAQFQLPEPLRPTVWTRAYEAKYDSAWWLCMSFCAANHIPQHKFEREYLGIQQVFSQFDKSALRGDCFIPLLLEEDEPVAVHLARTDPVYGIWKLQRARDGQHFFDLPFRRELLTRTLGFYAGSSTEALAYDFRTRYCLDCLVSGYHSLFHQIAPLKYCPIHETRLLDHCPGCRSKTVQFRFSRSGHLHGFTCGCGYKLGDGEWPELQKTPEFLAREATAMAPLMTWTRSLANLGMNFGGILRGYRDRGDDMLMAYSRVFPLLHSLVPFDGDLSLFDYRPAHNTYRNTLAPMEEEAHDRDALRHYGCIHKAIKRHIENRFLKAKGTTDYRQRLGKFMVNLQSRSVVPDPFACLFTQAHALWRLRTECFAVSALGYEPVPMRTVPRLKEITMGFSPVNATMVAYGLLAHYYRCVDAILECVEVAMPWSEEGISQFQQDTAFVDNHWRQTLSFAPEDVVHALDYATVKVRGRERAVIFLPDLSRLAESVAAYGAKVVKLAAGHAIAGPVRRKRRAGSRVNRSTNEARDRAFYERFVLEPWDRTAVKSGTRTNTVGDSA